MLFCNYLVWSFSVERVPMMCTLLYKGTRMYTKGCTHGNQLTSLNTPSLFITSVPTMVQCYELEREVRAFQNHLKQGFIHLFMRRRFSNLHVTSLYQKFACSFPLDTKSELGKNFKPFLGNSEDLQDDFFDSKNF